LNALLASRLTYEGDTFWLQTFLKGTFVWMPFLVPLMYVLMIIKPGLSGWESTALMTEKGIPDW